jgi:hypothetical protein
MLKDPKVVWAGRLDGEFDVASDHSELLEGSRENEPINEPPSQLFEGFRGV